MLRRLFVLLTLLGLCATTGCQMLALAARGGEDDISASYPGLKGQTVGIMVWADRGIVIDHPTITADVAKGLQQKLQQAGGAGADEVQKTQWYSCDSILRLQEDHPELETTSDEQVVKQLPVTRLIYIEIVNFSLHPNDAMDLSRGNVAVNLRVVESSSGKSKEAYQEDNVTAVYPQKSPPEGVTGLEDEDVYHYTVDALTSELAKRFVTHEADAE